MQTCFIFLTYPPFKLNAFDTTGPWEFNEIVFTLIKHFKTFLLPKCKYPGV